MRPDALTPLFASAQTLSGVGPRIVAVAEEGAPPAAGRHRAARRRSPLAHADRRHRPPRRADGCRRRTGHDRHLRRARPETQAAAARQHQGALQGHCEDDTGAIDLVFFHAERKFVERQLPVGEIRFVSGRVERLRRQAADGPSRLHRPPEARGDLPMLEPDLSADRRTFRQGPRQGRAARRSSSVAVMPEWQEPQWLASRALAVVQRGAGPHLHRPEDTADVVDRAPRPGSASPTTNCSPASWRSPSCARA